MEAPKQFLNLAGKPVLQYALDAFKTALPGIRFVLVIPQAYEKEATDILGACGVTERTHLALAGRERYFSVQNGLSFIPAGEGRIAVHDAARPLASPSLIQRCFDALELAEAVVPLIPVHDSVRMIREGGGSQVLDRNTLRAVQTPQCFRNDTLRKAYTLPFDPLFTDDASLAEKAGVRIHWIEGEPANLKLTTPEDRVIAEALLAARSISAP